MSHCLGVDPSLTSCGVATIRADGLVDTAHHGTRGHDNEPLHITDQRMRHITGFVAEHLTGCVLAIIEGPSLGSTGGHLHDRSGLWWRIVRRLLIAEVPVAVCPPTVLKKWATGFGGGPRASKSAVAVAVARLWPNVAAETDDEWDALALAHLGAQHLRWPVPVLARHASALKAVRWPENGAVRESNKIESPEVGPDTTPTLLDAPALRHPRGNGTPARNPATPGRQTRQAHAIGDAS